MAKLVVVIIILIVCEIIVAFFFALAAQLLYKKASLDIKSIGKGVIERIFLLIALLNNYPHALTLFSALKLATRLKHHEPLNDENRYNDYYLIGNLVSVAVAMGYVCLWQNFDHIKVLHSMAGS